MEKVLDEIKEINKISCVITGITIVNFRTWFLGYVSSPSAEEEQDNFWQHCCASLL